MLSHSIEVSPYRRELNILTPQNSLNILKSEDWDLTRHSKSTLSFLNYEVKNVIAAFHISDDVPVEKAIQVMRDFTGRSLPLKNDLSVLLRLADRAVWNCGKSVVDMLYPATRNIGLIGNFSILVAKEDLYDFGEHYGFYLQCPETQLHYFLSPNNPLTLKKPNYTRYELPGYNRMATVLFHEDPNQLLRMIERLEGGFGKWEERGPDLI